MAAPLPLAPVSQKPLSLYPSHGAVLRCQSPNRVLVSKTFCGLLEGRAAPSISLAPTWHQQASFLPRGGQNRKPQRQAKPCGVRVEVESAVAA